MMKHRDFRIAEFAEDVSALQLRGNVSARQVAKEAGIGAANMTRLYNEYRCGLDTFCALCVWGGLDANMYISGRKTMTTEHIENQLAQINASIDELNDTLERIATYLKELSDTTAIRSNVDLDRWLDDGQTGRWEG